jgi:phosphatidylglycerophosphate synthase
MPTTPRETRVHGSLLAAGEKRVLIWIAERQPRWVNSDHLTGLGAAGMLGAGLGYALSPHWRPALLLVVFFLLVNWFGDSLDGTLARVRRHERPRYGFYIDHVLDAVGILLLIGGLLAGGYVSLLPAAAFLLAYYLLTIEIALATHALGVFRISYWKFGPTELRILLAIGTLQLLDSPWSTIAGHHLLLFDIGTAIGAGALLVTFAVSAISNTRKLYALEPLPKEDGNIFLTLSRKPA